LLDASGQYLKASGPGATANFNAAYVLTVNNADFSNFGNVNMAAKTIVLSDVNFAANSQDTFTTPNHALAANPNTDQTVVPGDVNFVHGVKYGGILVTVPSGFVNGTIPGTGMVIQ
jgi:hypothetical protein